MPESFQISSVHRQHNSVVIVIPKIIRQVMDLNAGEKIVFKYEYGDYEVKISSLTHWRLDNDKAKEAQAVIPTERSP